MTRLEDRQTLILTLTRPASMVPGRPACALAGIDAHDPTLEERMV